MKISTEELLALVTVVDAGSITAAAAQLNQTTSGISRALSRLEDKLATTLLNRTTRRLELTEEGRLFVDRARRILAALDEAEELMAVRRERPSGRLRIDAPVPFVLHVLAPRIGEFRRQYPDILLELNSSDQFIDLLEQRTDVAIRFGQLQDSSLHARPLGRSRRRVLASPGYLARHGVPDSVAALADHVLIGFSQAATLNAWPLRHGGGDRYVITPSLSASSGETVRQLALADQGIGCLSDFMTQADRDSGRLVELFADSSVDLYLPINAVYYRNTQLAARIACFLDFLSETLAEGECGLHY
ncbi:LysR family transcriptional regulator [Crenobacter sp. SG2303]|uniref:LysR family transcriptional regulator n=1 Tax=Crenobacter oryzisoli TaxID=3056844 RepID=A0ABT7XT51_9NEIS|nr:LysR family transcriptional regulator [Crenobacter sp. SG2303]MDN0076982.1 LysR family transcriptional regulator [Crenobacter sp. SG2303]